MTFQSTLPWRIFINSKVVSSPWKYPPRGSRGRTYFFSCILLGLGELRVL